jgi:hypothetical protein
MSPWLSILLIHCSRRTTLLFLYVVLFERNFDWSTGLGERASVERPFEGDHLQKYCRSRGRNAESENIRRVLFILFNVW